MLRGGWAAAFTGTDLMDRKAIPMCAHGHQGEHVQPFGRRGLRSKGSLRAGTVLPVAKRYVKPDWFSRHVVNRLVAGMTRLGISIWGSRVLEVRGRKSGELRRNPVNPLKLNGARYLIAPRGNTQWVRNLRAAGDGHLLLGTRREHFSPHELPDDDKEPILRAYLTKWKWEVGQFFGGVGPDAPTEELRRIAPDHPVFEIKRLE